MNKPLHARSFTMGTALIGYLDLCGTKAVYETLSLAEQLNRITIAVSAALGELDNVFRDDKQSLYVHMFADSLVVAQKSKWQPKDCIEKLVYWLLLVQREMLQNSQSTRMPILTRGLVKSGEYYGLLFEQFGSTLDEIFTNFSLVGGSTIVEMDKILKGLPAGVYLDAALTSRLKDQARFLDVEGDQLKFVRPPDGFYDLNQIFGDVSFDKWVESLIKRSNDDKDFKEKIEPWSDAVQKKLTLIKCKQKDQKAWGRERGYSTF